MSEVWIVNGSVLPAYNNIAVRINAEDSHITTKTRAEAVLTMTLNGTEGTQ